MRKRFRVPLLAAFVGALAAPVGFALSVESSATTPIPSVTSTSSPIAATALVTSEPAREGLLPDAAKLLIVGASLLGVAAFVRKAI